MTEKNLGNSFSWWIGEVVNVKDPDESGRVQVRLLSAYDDEMNIADKDLPWALPLQSTTSAAHGKLGTAPVGLVKGSKIIGFWADKDQQYPIIMGSFGKSGDPKSGSNTDGIIEIDYSFGSIPSAAQASDPHPYNPYSALFAARLGIAAIDAGEKIVNSVSNTLGSIITKDVEKKMKEPKTPTTASADKNNKGDVLDTAKSVDPMGKGSPLSNMTKSYITVRNIMVLTSPGGLQSLARAVLTGSLLNLASSLGLGPVLDLIGTALQFQHLMQANLAAILSLAQMDLFNHAASNGGRVVTRKKPPVAVQTLTSKKPPSQFILDFPPDLYVKLYYSIDEDPYPGFITWIAPDNIGLVWTRRLSDEPNYISAEEEIEFIHTDRMTNDINNGILGDFMRGVIMLDAGIAVAGALDNLLGGALSSMADAGLSAIFGAGVSLNSISGFASKLIPGLAPLIGLATGGHIPTSFLQAGAVLTAITQFTKNQALLSVKKNAMQAALVKSAAENDQDTKDAALAYANAKLDSNPNIKAVSVSSVLSNGAKYDLKVTRL